MTGERVLAEALDIDWTPFWRETELVDEDGAYTVADFDRAAFTEAVSGRLDAAGYVIVPKDRLAALRGAAADLYSIAVGEHGHDETHSADWPACLPAHMAMNRYRASLSDGGES